MNYFNHHKTSILPYEYSMLTMWTDTRHLFCVCEFKLYYDLNFAVQQRMFVLQHNCDSIMPHDLSTVLQVTDAGHGRRPS